MTEKELKKLKRQDLLEILIAQSKEIDRLRGELMDVRFKMEERELIIQNAGSLAEAALGIYSIIENTQKAADLYLENVKRMGQMDASNADASQNQAGGQNAPNAQSGTSAPANASSSHPANGKKGGRS